MDSLRVDLGVLERLSGKMKGVPEKMDGTGRCLSRYGSDVGAPDVIEALNDFESHWGDGRKKIRSKADALGSMLDDTVSELRSTDEELRQSLGTSATSKQGY